MGQKKYSRSLTSWPARPSPSGREVEAAEHREWPGRKVGVGTGREQRIILDLDA